ncbi:MAG: M14 family zinc carboxypeptidase, partial [Actinomycetota bacterium]
MRFRIRAAGLVAVMLAATLASLSPQATAGPTPVASNEADYLAFGRVYPDPHGCLNQPPAPTPPGVSPFAKGKVCATQFLPYEESVAGAQFMEQRFSRYMNVIRLDQAYDNPNYMSAGLPKTVARDEDGNLQVNGRERVPLYLFKITDDQSLVPERERKHFIYSLSIHGIERAGLEGGLRAMEDLVTWAACELPKYNASVPPTPACAVEGPFPKKIVESQTQKPVPTAGDVLKRSVIYFVLPNPDGWARGQVAPVEVEDGSPNVTYTPGFFFQRFNGNGVDLNRDWPTKGYTYRPYSPASEPEIKSFGEVLKQVRNFTTAGQFTGGIDLHGMVTAYAFSYT